ncbi:MAG: VWA domain-containing protein [Candidatus Lokiarchaeota archaeon]|nr:VWA domain-containing protein [Candidatus Lokiarchaeota archaeon]
MAELKIFVDINEKSSDKVVICLENANKLGLMDGASVEVENPDNNKKYNAKIEISSMVLDFAAQISKNVIDLLEFSGVELVLRPVSSTGLIAPKLQIPKIPPGSRTPIAPQSPSLTPLPSPPPTITTTRPIPAPTSAPVPSRPPQPTPIPVPQPLYAPPPPQPTPAPTPIPVPQPLYAPPPPQPAQTPTPQVGFPPQPTPMQPVPSMPSQEIGMGPTTADPYPNKIDVFMLQSHKGGIVLTPVVDDKIEGGRIQLSGTVIQQLGLGKGLLIAWEDPLTRSMGSARIDEAIISPTEIRLSRDTKQDTNIQSQQIVVYSTEPPIQRASELMLEVQSQPNLMGYCLVNARTQLTLSIKLDDVLSFEDELTGAMGAGKVDILEEVPNNVIVIDSEILEASGIGSFEVKIAKNIRPIIPLQNISLGISPIAGENMWEIISTARQNVDSLKGWLANYIIFKGIKLRWNAVNIACSILNTVPDLTGDVLAQVTANTTINLSPTGLVPFNAILIVDISRSMMARDVLVTNIAPAIEGIKAAMESREIQEFLKHFKPGINIPRRIAAAFAAVLFLSEKVGRGFGEKVSVIRFADEGQILPFGDGYYMDSASGKKGVLEESARMIVDRIGNAYGQATNMSDAMVKAHQVLTEFDRMSPPGQSQPTMIIMLTDGIPTDGDAFLQTIKMFADNPNVVIYIVGLGNPDRELMIRAAQLCGGEYFEPEDAGELLIWYSKRARDLTVKMKSQNFE